MINRKTILEKIIYFNINNRKREREREKNGEDNRDKSSDWSIEIG